MKTLLVALAILAVIVAGVAVYLVATTPSSGGGLHFPLSPREQALLATVPDSAESLVLVPVLSAVEGKMKRNAVTRDFVDRFLAEQSLPLSWMIGGADLVAWRSGKETTFLLQLDPFRATVARAYLTLAGGRTRVLLDAPEGPGLPAAEVDHILALSARLPAGDALVVQRERARGAFPPIGRPAVTSVAISPGAIDIVSRAAAGSDRAVDDGAPLHARYARGALLTAAFAAPPRIIGEMNRLVGARASDLLRDGGAVAIYTVDAGRLLPRPREVLVMPATPERRVALQRFTAETLPREVTQAAGFRIETGEAENELLLAFDDDSLARYRGDSFAVPQLPANVWAVYTDPQRAGPVLERLASNPGLRYLAPRIHRAVRDAAGWMAHLRPATSVEAGLTQAGGTGELRVRIASK